ncbi:hypothetical protein [Streptomyces mayonensis]|uniref:hypothetical protein n=1 Tax=Streptomyces mayonensis TaxID=2750816 RepID=UPI001C1DFCBC|nr:hypothetical protein [Streptomyces sp. A108]MBU6531024.1 hypothetical protein [Streptomyces sp. A108]
MNRHAERSTLLTRPLDAPEHSRTPRTPGTRRPRLRLLAVGLAVAGLSLTAACGSGGDTEADSGKGVDTLESGSPKDKDKEKDKESASKDGGDSAVDPKRPQLRLDTSEEEKQRLTDAYNACLQAHGVPMNTKRAALAGAKQAAPQQGRADAAKYRPAYEACEVKLPLQPPETRPESNPDYADDFRVYVKCLQKKGMKIHLIKDTSVSADGLGWTYDEDTTGTLPDSQVLEADRSCSLEAFGDK